MKENFQTISFKIAELDCQEEVNLLEKTLKKHKGVKYLEFHILHSKMIVSYDPQEIDSGEIAKLIASTGMTGSLLSATSDLAKLSFWQKHKRAILCYLSGFFLVSALISHYSMHPSFLDLIEEKFLFHPHVLPAQVIFLYVLAIVCGSWFIIPRAIQSLKRWQADMNVLMIVAVVGAMIIHQWFEAATVAFLFSVAALLEHWSVEKARRTISSLLDLSPNLARVSHPNGTIEEKKVDEIELGEIIVVRPGEKFPLDAEVIKGTSSVNQAPITGESIPIFKSMGDLVFAGTLNEEGLLECKVIKKASDTTLSRIIQMVQEAQGRKASYEQWVQRFAKIYTPLMIALSLIVMIMPPVIYHLSWTEWFYRGLVLLVIACPCALVISTPVSVVSGLTSAARQGILIKGGLFLEAMGKIQAIAFDKTGTLTQGHPEVQKIVPLQGHSEEDILLKAVSLETGSHHPLARAILKEAEKRGIKPIPVSDFYLLKGKGAIARMKNQIFWIGSHRFMHEKQQETEAIHTLALQLEDEGHSVVALGNEQHVCGLISIADSPRPFVKETLLAIKELGIEKTVMLTGDNFPTAQALAQFSGIDSFYSELLPEDKMQSIQDLTKQYGHVAMVGDGVNDAPAMSSASVSIAMGSIGTDVAFESADIVLMGDDLSQIPKLIRHARKCSTVIKQNIFFALSIKTLVLLMAIAGFVSLWMAIAADSGASLIVVMNGLRLLRQKDQLPL
jgi:Zn2+/Cd2+-exporting ATPase